MKRIKIKPISKKLILIISLTIVFSIGTFVACVYWQDDPLVFESMTVAAGDEITIIVKPLFKPAQDNNGTRMVISILVPKIWNVSKGNAVVTYENLDVDPGVIFPMFIIPDETSPKQNQWQGMTWADAMKSRFGIGQNVPGSDMEWVTYWSIPYNVRNLDVRNVNVFVKIKTSYDNVKCKLGFFVNHSDDGISTNADHWKVLFMDEPFETVGAPGGLIDFCEEHPNVSIPMFASKDDIVTLKYMSGVRVPNFKGDTINTALYGASDVYLNASAFTTAGNVYEVSVISEKTHMFRESELNHSLTFWPAEYFKIPENEVIGRVEYYFVNADQSRYVKELNEDGTESPFLYIFGCR